MKWLVRYVVWMVGRVEDRGVIEIMGYVIKLM